MFPGATDEREATDTADRSDRDGETDARGRESDRGGRELRGRPCAPGRNDDLSAGDPIRAPADPDLCDTVRRLRPPDGPALFRDLGVVDRGDVRAWNDVEAYLEYLTSSLREAVWNDAVLLTLAAANTPSRSPVPARGTRGVRLL